MQVKMNQRILQSLYRHWRIYLVTGILGLYGLGSLSALWSGVYGFEPELKCKIPFIKDYFYHIDLLIVFPVVFLLLHQYFKNASHCLSVHLKDTPLPYQKDKGFSSLYKKWLLGMILFAVSLIVILTTLNIKSLIPKSNDVLQTIVVAREIDEQKLSDVPETSDLLKTWFTPSTKTLPATVFYFGEIAMFSIVAAVILAHHFTVMMELRKIAVPDQISDLTWSIAPGGPINATLTSLLYAVCVTTFIPVGIIFGRTYYMGLSPFDLVTVFNMTLVPLIILLIIVLPFSLTGIPKCLRTIRQKLLDDNEKKIGELWKKISDGGIDEQRKAEIVEEIDRLAEVGDVIKSRYPVIPLAEHAKKIVSVASALPVIVSVLAALRSLILALEKTQ